MQESSAEKKIYRTEGTYGKILSATEMIILFEAIILAPTRELCLQILTTLSKLCQPYNWIVPGVVMGGEKKKSEKARLRKGITILVATPGRLLDHLNTTSSFKIDYLKFLVLDEADRLLDMGFEKDITSIVSILRARAKSVQGGKGFQSILISATLEDGIQRLAGESLRNPKFISTDKEVKPSSQNEIQDKPTEATDSKSLSFHAPTQLHQFYVSAPSKERLVSLLAFIRWKAAEMYESCMGRLFTFLTGNSVK
jgi:ATP-dependent RNA helicase DDX31/DBP7